MSRFPFPFFREGQASMRDLQEEMNNLLQRIWHAGVSTGPLDGQEWAPVLDVIEEAERFLVRAEVPGLRAEDISVSVSGQTLKLGGQKRSDYSDAQQKGILQHERRFGAFCRSIQLPAEVDASRVAASCRDGVLEVELPKTEASRPKSVRVEIKA